MYCVIHSRYVSEPDSSKFLSRNFRMPGKRNPFSPLTFFLANPFSAPSRPVEGGWPYSSMFWMRAGNFSNGVSKSNPCAYAPSSKVRFRIAEPDPGPSPPSKSGRDQSLMIFDGSKSYFDPSPLQAGHAPYGELKLNERG